MFDKELFKKICEVSCGADELEKFTIGMDKKEFDSDNPFAKYYDVGEIICAIEKYQKKEIDAKFLSNWSNAYDWIIMGGFKIESKDNSVSLKDLLIFEISDWLDSLSFFDGDEDFYNLEDYKNTFKVLDGVLQDVNDCEAIFAFNAEEDNYEKDKYYFAHHTEILIRNNKKKYFINVCTDCIDYDDRMLFHKVAIKEIEKQQSNLKAQGYLELLYGYSSEDAD